MMPPQILANGFSAQPMFNNSWVIYRGIPDSKLAQEQYAFTTLEDMLSFINENIKGDV